MYDPDTLILSFGPFCLWHHDPCNKRGCGDDSCGWFIRASHGDPEMLKRIERAIEFDFDRVFNYRKEDPFGEPTGPIKNTYFRGLFCPNGEPNFSTMGIVLNMFWSAIHEYYNHDWNKSRPWMRKHLFDILIFAENPTDSLRDGIVGTFRDGEKAPPREERIASYASCIYGWILRTNRPWYKHPRWHVHHWKLTCWSLKRWPGIRRFFPENYCANSNVLGSPTSK